MEGVGKAIKVESDAKARELLEFNTIVAKLKDHVAAVSAQLDAKVDHITKKREVLGERTIELTTAEHELTKIATENSEKSARLAEDNMTVATLSTRGDESVKMLEQEKRVRVSLQRDVANYTTQKEEEAKKEALRVDEISKTRTAVAMCTDRVAQVQADCNSLEEQRAEQDELETNFVADLSKREQAVAMKRANIKGLKRDLHDLSSKIAQVEAAIVETNTSMASVKAYITAEIEGKDSQLMRLAGAKTELENFNKAASVQLSTFMQQVAAAQDAYAGQIRETEAAHVHQQTLLKQKGESIAQLADKIAEAQVVIERLRIAIAEESARNTQLEQTVQQATSLKNIRTQECDELSDMIRQASNTQDRRVADNAVINAKVEGAAERNKLLMENLQALDVKLTESKDKLESLTASTESLTARITSETLVEEQLKMQDTDLKTRKRKLNTVRDAAKEEARDVQHEIDDFNMLRDAEIDALQKRIAARSRSKAVEMERIAELESKMREAEAARTKLASVLLKVMQREGATDLPADLAALASQYVAVMPSAVTPRMGVKD
jgi:chromosome segregation ATPase